MPRPLRRPTAGATAKPTRKPGERAFDNAYTENAFQIYRDMGPDRSFRKLIDVLGVRFPGNVASLGTVSKWSQDHRWQSRIAEFERGKRMSAPAVVTAAPQITNEPTDDVVSLRTAAAQALAAAVRVGTLTVTKPGDVRALVDTASKALELADKLENERTGTATSDQIAALGIQLLDRIEQARRKDTAVMIKAVVQAACKIIGNGMNVRELMQAGAAAVGLRLDAEGEVEWKDGEIEVHPEADATEEHAEQEEDAALDLMDLMNRLKG